MISHRCLPWWCLVQPSRRGHARPARPLGRAEMAVVVLLLVVLLLVVLLLLVVVWLLWLLMVLVWR